MTEWKASQFPRLTVLVSLCASVLANTCYGATTLKMVIVGSSEILVLFIPS